MQSDTGHFSRQGPHETRLGRCMTKECETAIGQLTQGQLECLVLVGRHLTSKEIAPILGVSPHTVDQRIRTALRVLGCRNRLEAARLISSCERPDALFFQTPSGREPLVNDATPMVATKPRLRLILPFATGDHPQNQMTVAQRIWWILIISCGAAFSMGLYLAGLVSLARLLEGT